MILHTRADSVKILSDEQGYELLIETDEGDSITVNIQACVFDFYAAVQTEVRPYILEAEMARRSLPVSGDEGYELDDPKHSTYFDRMVD